MIVYIIIQESVDNRYTDTRAFILWFSNTLKYILALD